MSTVSQSDRMALMADLRREDKLQRQTNVRDDVCSYQLENADGLTEGPILRMTRSEAERRNEFRDKDIARAEAFVAAEQKKRLDAEKYKEAMDRSEDTYRRTAGLPAKVRQPEGSVIGPAEWSAIEFLEHNRGYLWTLQPE